MCYSPFKKNSMASIKHLFHINAPKEKVFEAITTIESLAKWWTTDTSGDASPGGIIRFWFGGGGPEMKVKEMKPGESLTWECVGGAEGWLGHLFTFTLDTNDNKTRVRFEQSGWKEADDFYAACNFSWGRYMESLRQLCQTGKGEAFGSEGYRK
jgi:uncharacterized protein YndB with AHSA1/START domain